MSKVIKTIDERETQKQNKTKQTNKQTKKKNRTRGNNAIAKGWEINDFVERLS